MPKIREILKRLRAIREEMRLKQEYLARRLGVDRTTYIRKEKGMIPITTEEWLKLAEAMDKDPDHFFNPDNKGWRGEFTKEEELLLKLYRSLTGEERRDFIAFLCLLLKGIKRKKVQITLQLLKQHNTNL